MGKMQKNMKFFVRVFPLKSSDENVIKIEANKKELYALCLQDAKADNENGKDRYWKFYTDGIFFNSSQDEVYVGTMDGVAESALKGGKAVIMVYGQTGAGKSLTLSGLRNNYEHRGIIPRLLTALFKEKEDQKSVAKIDYWMSCIELKGREVKDLLGPILIPSKHRSFDILKDIHHKKIISEKSALTLLFKAESRRSISKTAPYPASHLGHCIVTVYLRRTDLLLSGGCITYGKVHFIDLAGIDSGNATSTWKSCKDIGKANVVKSFLEQYLTQYSQHIPSSKPGMFVQGRVNNLIYYLADSLTPSCLICLVGHIYCSVEHLNITLSTLKFGQRISDELESSQVHYEREREPKLYMQALESEVEQQKRELEVITLLANDSKFCVSQSCYDLVIRIATSYLQGNDSEFLTLLSYGQAKLVLEVFRELYKKLEAEKLQLEIEQQQQQQEQSEQDISQQSLTKMIKKSTNSINKNRKSKRTSRQLGKNAPIKSETSKTSTASQTDEKASTESLSNLVGESDKKGIGIGAGIVTSYEGAVVKFIKEGASTEPNICDDAEGQQESKPLINIKIIVEGDGFIADPDNMPSVDVLWKVFLNSAPQIASLKSKFDNLCDQTRQAQSDYISAAALVSDCIVDLENAKLILAQQQKAWYAKLNYVRDEVEVTADTNEDAVIQSIKEKEIEMKTNKEVAKAAKENVISLSKAKLNTKHELEMAFQNYCLATYGLPPLNDLPANREPEKINPCEEQFQMLQESILLRNPVLAKYTPCYSV